MYGWKIIWAALLLMTLSSIITLMVGGWNEETFRYSVRFSIRAAFFFFISAFAARALYHVKPHKWTEWLLTNRRFLGITFGILFAYHIITLVILQYAFHPVFTLATSISLIGGGVAFGLGMLMLTTSFDKTRKLISPKAWDILHTIGGYWIALLFLRTYGKSITSGNYEFIPYAMAIIIVLILRLNTVLTSRKSKVSH